MSDTKRCPFCKSNKRSVIVRKRKLESVWPYKGWVECLGCKGRGPLAYGSGKDMNEFIIKLWNGRTENV